VQHPGYALWSIPEFSVSAQSPDFEIMKMQSRYMTCLALTFAVASLVSASLFARQVDNPLGGVLPEQEQPPTLPLQPREARKVNPKLAGWQEAGLGTDGGRIESVLRANWVAIDDQSAIHGQILGETGPITVHLLRNGFLEAQATTSEEGEFVFESTSPGPYSLVGCANGNFFAWGFNAVEGGGAGAQLPLTISTMPTSGSENFHLIAKLLAQHSTSVRFPSYPEYETQQGLADPASLFGFVGLKSYTENARPATSIQHHPVAIQPDGRLIGRVHQLHGRSGRPIEINGTSVKLIQEGEVVAESQADAYGVFEFAGLAEGRYEFVATGTDGFAALGIEAFVVAGPVPALEGAEAQNAGFSSLNPTTSLFQEEIPSEGVPAVFDCCLVDPESIGWVNSYIQEESYRLSMNEPRIKTDEQYPPNFNNFGGDCCGGAGGWGGAGGGFGGGGGFGLGGAGNWLIAGAIAIAIADSVSSDANFGGAIVLPPPVSPNN
jgi:hypothetical protein